MPKALSLPAAAITDERSRELLRVWAAEGKQHNTLATDSWKDPAAWGICLVDLARHIARAYAQLGRQDAADALARIQAGFDTEWGTPTDELGGSLLS